MNGPSSGVFERRKFISLEWKFNAVTLDWHELSTLYRALLETIWTLLAVLIAGRVSEITCGITASVHSCGWAFQGPATGLQMAATAYVWKKYCRT